MAQAGRRCTSSPLGTTTCEVEAAHILSPSPGSPAHSVVEEPLDLPKVAVAVSKKAEVLLTLKASKNPFIEESVLSQLGEGGEQSRGIWAPACCRILMKLLFAPRQARPHLIYGTAVLA